MIRTFFQHFKRRHSGSFPIKVRLPAPALIPFAQSGTITAAGSQKKAAPGRGRLRDLTFLRNPGIRIRNYPDPDSIQL